MSEVNSVGVLLSNLGTPDLPVASSVRKYLREFLMDPRVIEIPKMIWLPILYGLILPFRSQKSAKLYQKIWMPEGSPLRVNLDKQAQKLRQYFEKQHCPIRVFSAMRYGNPSFDTVMQEIQQQGIRKLLLFPLYPQYSSPTTATTFDKIVAILKTWRYQPEFQTITDYHQHPGYIGAIGASIQDFWQNAGPPEKLLFSFHGLPEKMIKKGDPYYQQCLRSARLIAQFLKLTDTAWSVSFQSRLGRTPWLQPYTDQMLSAFPRQGIKNVQVICPGFSSDCLETLEEINHENRQIFMQAGGERFDYIPALNDSDRHIAFLAKLIQTYTAHWV